MAQRDTENGTATRRLRFSAPLVGYPLFLMWFEGTKSFDINDVSSDPSSAFSLCIMATDLIALVLIACLYRRIVSLRNRKRLMGGVAFLVALATVAPLVPYAGINLSVPAAGTLGVIGGLARAVLTLAWMEAFSQFDMRTACIRFSLCTIAGAVSGTLLGAVLPGWANDLVNGAAGITSSLLVRQTSGTQTAGTGDIPHQAGLSETTDVVKRWSFPLKPTVLMGIFAVATLLVANLSGPLQADTTPKGTQNIIASLLLLTMASRGSGRFDIRALGTLALPFACIGLLGSLSVFSEFPIPAAFSASMAYYLFSTFTYALLFNISFRYGVNPLWLFGFSRAPRIASAIAIPALTGSGIIASTSPEADAVLAVAVVVVASVSSLLVTGRSFDTTWGIKPLEETDGENGPTETAPSLEERCSRVAYLYGLTKREEEVLALLAHGLSTPDIERELSISNGTARNHIQHVYRKLSVHSRDEARILVESEQVSRWKRRVR